MTIDFVSDVSCPWCIIGLAGLEEALARIGDVVNASIRLHPFELNPDMEPEGQNIAEHIAQKYGSSPDQMAASRETIRARAAEVGFTMDTSGDRRIYNTFDAHRLLHWAGEQGRQLELKHALFEAYFTRGQNPSDHAVLVEAAEKAALDPAAAAEVLASGRYGDNVRAAERFWHSQGISAVPAAIIDGRYLISGGQPAAVFERALRSIATES
jgi:predicted DsbA family dithiol-disulfide isomerase